MQMSLSLSSFPPSYKMTSCSAMSRYKHSNAKVANTTYVKCTWHAIFTWI